MGVGHTLAEGTQAEGCRIADIAVIARHPTPESQDRAFRGPRSSPESEKKNLPRQYGCIWMGIGEATIAQRYDRN
jgi:hypothetical protein